MKCVHTFLGNVNEMLILCYIFKLLKKKKSPFSLMFMNTGI